jgi:hypothetical protein
MNLGDAKQRFGIYWLFFGYTLALHVLDEAGNHFLSFYNPSVEAMRRAFPWFPAPVFTFEVWVGRLALGLTLWLALAPLAFRGLKWMRWVAGAGAILGGIANGLGHVGTSIYYGRFMPGVFSAPLILLSGVVLLWSVVRWPGSVSLEEALSRS